MEDNGLGMSDERLEQVFSGADDDGSGIGLSNVNERLRVVYGSSAACGLTSEPGQGTIARIEIPDTGAGGGGPA